MHSALPLLLLLLTIAHPAAVLADFESTAEIYRHGNYAAAFSEFLPLAKGGDPRAQTIIAMMYKYGESVEQNWTEAFTWYSKAAEQGYAPAQYGLGEMYADGKGVERDPPTGIRWLTLAAKAGFAKANDKLAELHADEVTSSIGKGDLIAWSQSWNLHLPESAKDGASPPAPVARAVTADVPVPVTADVPVPVTADVPVPQVVGIQFRVQLGAMKTLAAVQRIWSSVSGPNGDLFANLQPIFRSKYPEPSLVYVVQTGPFPTLAAAKGFCDALVARGVNSGCFAVKTTDEIDQQLMPGGNHDGH